MSNDLIGVWQTDPDDVSTQQFYGNVTMDFRDDGELIYVAIEGGKEQRIFMTYEINGNRLITDQQSFPQKVITEFSLIGKNLELNFDGIKSKYVKIG